MRFLLALALFFAPLPNDKPHSEWPFTDDQFKLLLYDAFDHSFDPALRKKMNVETWEQMHDFIYALIESDYTKIVQESVVDAGYFYKMAYSLIGLHGSIEDAADLYAQVKEIVFNRKGSLDHELAQYGMIRGLGYFLMRDHYFPQKNRALMQEIEVYLFRCSDWETPSCWPYDYGFTEEEFGRPFTEHEKRPYRPIADEAISYGLSQRAFERCQKWLEAPQSLEMEWQAKLCISNLKGTEKFAQKIMPYLKPVLTYEEMMDETNSAVSDHPIRPRRPLPNVLKQKPPLRIDLPFGFEEISKESKSETNH